MSIISLTFEGPHDISEFLDIASLAAVATTRAQGVSFPAGNGKLHRPGVYIWGFDEMIRGKDVFIPFYAGQTGRSLLIRLQDEFLALIRNNSTVRRLKDAYMRSFFADNYFPLFISRHDDEKKWYVEDNGLHKVEYSNHDAFLAAHKIGHLKGKGILATGLSDTLLKRISMNRLKVYLAPLSPAGDIPSGKGLLLALESLTKFSLQGRVGSSSEKISASVRNLNLILGTTITVSDQVCRTELSTAVKFTMLQNGSDVTQQYFKNCVSQDLHDCTCHGPATRNTIYGLQQNECGEQ